MGTARTAVDPQALLLAAQRLDTAADILQEVLGTHLGALQFDGAVRAAVDQLASDVAVWERSAREVAAALRTGAECYGNVEERAVAALR